ncbi:MAG: matrixin family metalloprotease [Ornithinimicrobium sp.]
MTSTSQVGRPFAAKAPAQTLAPGTAERELPHMQLFLERFGYLQPGSYETGHLDPRTSTALRAYQRFAGLEPSGEFDAATREQMNTGRCGMPDFTPQFATIGAWECRQLTYAFDVGTPDVPGTAELDAVRAAFATWASATAFSFVQVRPYQSPDIVVGWRPADDPDRSMVGGLIAHADFPLGYDLVTSSLPKPVHFDSDEVSWGVDGSASAHDVETAALHEIGHILGLRHSGDPEAIMYPSIPRGFLQRSPADDDLAGVRRLYPASSVPSGTYTLMQQQTFRYLDAHDSRSRDFSAVTRDQQRDSSQRWVIEPVAVVVTLRQLNSGRFLDAHESNSHDYAVVTEGARAVDSQRWVMKPAPGGTSTLQQLSTARYLDAHEARADFALMTRPDQDNDSQRWHVDRVGDRLFTLRQGSSGRLVEGLAASDDFSVVARDGRNNDAQRWLMAHVGTVYTLRQESTGRYLDAHTNRSDFSAVTRQGRDRDGQRWVFLAQGDGSFTVQQLGTGRFLDAYEIGHDFSVVTRTAQDNASQRWLLNSQ